MTIHSCESDVEDVWCHGETNSQTIQNSNHGIRECDIIKISRQGVLNTCLTQIKLYQVFSRKIVALSSDELKNPVKNKIVQITRKVS